MAGNWPAWLGGFAAGVAAGIALHHLAPEQHRTPEEYYVAVPERALVCEYQNPPHKRKLRCTGTDGGVAIFLIPFGG